MGYKSNIPAHNWTNPGFNLISKVINPVTFTNCLMEEIIFHRQIMVLNFTRYPNSLIFKVPEHYRRNKIYLLTYNKTISLRSYLTGGHFKNAQLKSIMYPFCRSLAGNQIEELPAGVFSNNNKLLNLWVGRLKVLSRPIYFYCKILLQILVNSKILKY